MVMFVQVGNPSKGGLVETQVSTLMVQRMGDVYTRGSHSQRVDIWVGQPPNTMMNGIFQDVIERQEGGITVLPGDNTTRATLVFEMNVDASRAASDWIEAVNGRIKEMADKPSLLAALAAPPINQADVMAISSAGLDIVHASS
jgi:hypothetical protein